MSLLDTVMVGKVVKDLGTIDEWSIGFGSGRRSALVVRRHGKLNLVLKMSGRFLLGFGVSYFPLPMETIPKVKQIIAQAEEVASGGSEATA